MSTEPQDTSGNQAFEREWRARFDRFAARGGSNATISGWSEHGLSRRMDVVLTTMDKFLPPNTQPILDLGCGSGVYCRELYRSGRRMVGADYSTGMLKRARDTCGPLDVPLLAANSFHLPFQSGVFGGLINIGVMQHLEDEQRVFAEIARCLAPGGVAFIDTLNRRSVQSCLSAGAAHIKALLRLSWPPRRHAIRRSAAQMRSSAAAAGLETVAILAVPIFPRSLRILEHLGPSCPLFLSNTMMIVFRKR